MFVVHFQRYYTRLDKLHDDLYAFFEKARTHRSDSEVNCVVNFHPRSFALNEMTHGVYRFMMMQLNYNSFMSSNAIVFAKMENVLCPLQYRKRSDI